MTENTRFVVNLALPLKGQTRLQCGYNGRNFHLVSARKSNVGFNEKNCRTVTHEEFCYPETEFR